MQTIKKLALALTVTICACNGDPKAGAWRFAEELEMPVAKISCTERDMDGDGYVSCTFKLTDGTVDYYECASYLSFNRGCKPKIKVFQQ